MVVNAITQLRLLRCACGVAPVKLLHCPNESCSQLASVVKAVRNEEWARCLICDECGATWKVCVFCSGSRTHLQDQCGFVKHKQRYHKKRKRETSITEAPVKSCHGFVALPHGSRNIARYFWESQSGDGPACLVARSQFRMDGMQSQLTPLDIRMAISLGHMVLMLSRDQNEELSSLLRMVVFHTKSRFGVIQSWDLNKESLSQRDENGISPWQCQVPTTPDDLRSKFMVGKYAMIPSLPIPKVKMLDTNHAYVSLRDCVQDMLMHEISVEPVENLQHSAVVTKLSGSRMASSLYRDAINKYGSGNCYTLWFNEWSDDFEPNSMSKNNRGSVWIKSITISCPFDNRNSYSNTYPIAVGPKGVSHEQVEAELAKEMAELAGNESASDYFIRGSNVPVSVHAGMMASLQDQPERRSANHMLGLGGKYSARWRYSCDLAAIANTVLSCS